MNVYIAAPLFNEQEKNFNEIIDSSLRKIGYETYLPQRDGGMLSKLVKDGGDEKQLSEYIFNLDIKAVEHCDILLFLLDGRVPDEGACFELGMAYTLNKTCVGYKTDCRSFADGYDNLMIRKALSKIFSSENEMITFFKKRKKGQDNV